eukprot:scaffold3607_cov114-Isochrysis_galbana.AAC.28
MHLNISPTSSTPRLGARARPGSLVDMCTAPPPRPYPPPPINKPTQKQNPAPANDRPTPQSQAL